jgi:hypothetical protein
MACFFAPEPALGKSTRSGRDGIDEQQASPRSIMVGTGSDRQFKIAIVVRLSVAVGPAFPQCPRRQRASPFYRLIAAHLSEWRLASGRGDVRRIAPQSRSRLDDVVVPTRLIGNNDWIKER